VSPLTVSGDSAATLIGILAPSDPNYAAGQLSITVTSLPSNGKVVLADGTTPVTSGEALTVEQLTGLRFEPPPGVFDQTSTFAYTVKNPAGLSTVGSVTLTIRPSRTPPALQSKPDVRGKVTAVASASKIQIGEKWIDLYGIDDPTQRKHTKYILGYLPRGGMV